MTTTAHWTVLLSKTPCFKKVELSNFSTILSTIISSKQKAESSPQKGVFDGLEIAALFTGHRRGDRLLPGLH